MPNITLAMDEQLLAAARALAKTEGTSLNAMVRRLVSEAIGQKTQREAARGRLLEKMDKSTARIPKDYKFNRAELYDTPSVSGHKHTGLRNRRKAV